MEEERLKIKQSRYDYPEEDDLVKKESDEKEEPENSTSATGYPTLLAVPPMEEGTKCAIDVRPFADEEDMTPSPAPEAEEGARCGIDLRPFDDSEKFEEESMAAVEVKVCDVGVSRVVDPNPQGTAEGARVACEDKAEEILMQCEYEERAPTTQDIECILEYWVGHQNRHRGKAMPKDRVAVESDAFGLVKSLSCVDPIIARNTRNYPCIAMTINQWMMSQCTDKRRGKHSPGVRSRSIKGG